MGDHTDNISEEINQILRSRLTAVLATQGKEGPWTTLVSFSASEDMKTLWFATSRVTRKFANLNWNSNVSMLMDTRTNSVSDLYSASALTSIGHARELHDTERENALALMKEQHEYLSAFLSSPTVAIIQVNIRKYILVTSFQNVREVTVHD